MAKCACDFLLVISSNLGPILHRFRYAATVFTQLSFNARARRELFRILVELNLARLESRSGDYPSVKIS